MRQPKFEKHFLRQTQNEWETTGHYQILVVNSSKKSNLIGSKGG